MTGEQTEQMQKDLIKKKNLMFGLGFCIVIFFVGIVGHILISENYIHVDNKAQQTTVNNHLQYAGLGESLAEQRRSILSTAPESPIMSLINSLTMFQWMIIIGILGSIICGHQLYTMKKSKTPQ